MRLFCLLGIVGMCLLTPVVRAAPVPIDNAKYEIPTFVGQTYSINAFISDIRNLMNSVAPQQEIASFEKETAQLLGEEKKRGVDIDNPIGFYGYLRPKIQETELVVVFPILDRPDAIAFAERFGFQVKLLDQKNSIYELRQPGLGIWRARILERQAYLLLRFDEKYDALPARLEKDQLIPINRLVDPESKSAASAQLTVDRIPGEVQTLLLSNLDEVTQSLQQLPAKDVPLSVSQLGVAFFNHLKVKLAQSFKEGRNLQAKANINPKSAAIILDTSLIAIDKTALAKEIQELKPAQGRFSGLVTKSSVAGGWVATPQPLPKELLTSASLAVEELLGTAKEGAPKEFQPIIQAIVKQLGATINKGEIDLGFAFQEANKDGHHTVIAALGLEDPLAIVKAILAEAKNLPKDWAEKVKLNALKIGEINVHEVDVSDLSEGVTSIFGPKAKLYFALSDKVAYLAVGPDAVTEMKRAIELKPAPCLAINLKLNMSKYVAVLKKVGNGAVARLERDFGNASELASLFEFDFSGGSALNLRIGFSMLLSGGALLR